MTEQFSDNQVRQLTELHQLLCETRNLICGNLPADNWRISDINIRHSTRHPKRTRPRLATRGFVYLIQSPTGAYKIGRTVNPKDRLKTFAVKLPFEVEYVCVIQTDDMHGLESQLHNRFAEKRVNGEWFNLDASDVEYIKGLAS